MKHIVSPRWNRSNRSERIRSIVAALNQFGRAEVGYAKGRSYIAKLFLGKGHPQPVDEDDEWNHMRITYQGKDALKIFDSRLGPFRSKCLFDGYFFDEHFTEGETQKIEDVLADAEIFTWQAYASKEGFRLVWLIVVVWGLFSIFYGCIRGDFVFSILSLGYTLICLWLLLRK